MRWTPEMIEELRQMRDQDMSARQIAERLGVTRNAVIGKIDRLRRAENGAPPAKAAAPKKASTQKPPEPKKPEPVADVESLFEELCNIPPLGPVTLMDLREGMCKWPNGEPGRDDFHFCGAATPRAGLPYCREHFALAYRPAPKRNLERLWRVN